MWQATHVRDRLLSLHPGLQVTISGVTTEADRFADKPLSAMGGKGVFVKELEQALLAGHADIAVHSMKDLPVQLPPGLALGAVLEREDPRDVLVSRDRTGLASLPQGARVGTSSLRRRCQLLHRRPDLRILDVRGNVDTRLAKLVAGDFDALVLAAAGLTRLGHREAITEYLPGDVMLPAIGQGALGVECRADDPAAAKLIEALNDPGTRACVEAERAVNRRLGGSCLMPIAAFAEVAGPRLGLQALIGSPDGSRLVRGAASGDAPAAIELGESVAESLLARGGSSILEELQDAGRG